MGSAEPIWFWIIYHRSRYSSAQTVLGWSSFLTYPKKVQFYISRMPLWNSLPLDKVSVAERLILNTQHLLFPSLFHINTNHSSGRSHGEHVDFIIWIFIKGMSISGVFIIVTFRVKKRPPTQKHHVECVVGRKREGGCAPLTCWHVRTVSLSEGSKFKTHALAHTHTTKTTTFIQEAPSAHSGNSWGQELLPGAGNFPTERPNTHTQHAIFFFFVACTHTHTFFMTPIGPHSKMGNIQQSGRERDQRMS